MGVYLALEAAWRGARVSLVHGPLCVPLPAGWDAFLERSVAVETAEEMRRELERLAPAADIGIYAAAVTDYAPAKPLQGKLDTRESPEAELRLVATPKAIEAAVEANPSAIHVGFAADPASSTEELLERARAKLERYRLDLVAANNVAERGAGFGSETNHVYIVSWMGWTREIPRMHKRLVARRVLDAAREAASEGPRPR
jgi:phosphopantothenoylcysteine decarboxylase/phosphopantothenate--cysteine ligase